MSSFNPLNTVRPFAKDAAIAAGEYLQRASKNSIKIVNETDRDIKLEADIESEKIIINIL